MVIDQWFTLFEEEKSSEKPQPDHPNYFHPDPPVVIRQQIVPDGINFISVRLISVEIWAH